MARLFLLLLPLFGLACTSTRDAAAPGIRSQVVDTSDHSDAFASSVSEKLVREYALTLVVPRPDSAAARLDARVAAVGGYLVERYDYTLVYRVPTERVATFLDTADRYGKVVDRTTYTQDLTAQYYDTAARIESLEALRTRYLALLAKADSVTDLLAVETELARVNLELDQLKGDNRRIDQRVAYSLVRITLRERVRLGPLGFVFKGLYESVAWLFVRK